MKKKRYLYLLALLPFLVVTFMYEIIPLITIIINSFRPDDGGGFTLENYHTVFSKLLYRMAITNSIKISLISAGIGIVIAFLGARASKAVGGKLRSVFMTVLNMVSAGEFQPVYVERTEPRIRIFPDTAFNPAADSGF